MNIIIEKKYGDSVSTALTAELSEKLGLNLRLTELLVSRGYDSEDKINKFLCPDKNNLYDPFLMKNMKEARDRILEAIKNHEKVVIYGDYDTDGVCSAAVLSLFLAGKGLDVGVHIPNRYTDGYGLNNESIEEIAEKESPDLIITCDCGISCRDEVEYINDLGIDTIVTDHHEPGDRIPEGIVVNPKQQGDAYPDKMLCGTGVAFKLIQTLSEKEEYMEYIDLVCVATIADLVPLLNENRLLVQLGLKKINSGKYNLGLKHLFSVNALEENVMSSDIAFKIGPRLNAAGRIGDAYRAFELLITSDENKIARLTDEIEKDNDKRKMLCDRIYSDAQKILKEEVLLGTRVLVLVNEKWEKGVTGIAAAKFAGEYKRPTFIIVDKDEKGYYKGTARGIEGINIYNALQSCKDILSEFGGHSGAAGFSLHESNIPEFRRRINEHMSGLDERLFLDRALYDIDIGEDEIGPELYDACCLLEPTGQDNKKPLFKVNVRNLNVSPCKNSAHTSLSFGACQLFAFNNTKKNQFLLGDDEKSVIFEMTGKRGSSITGTAKFIIPSDLYVNNAYARAIYLYDILYNGLLYAGKQGNCALYEEKDIAEIIGDSNFGTLVISGSREDAESAYAAVKDRLFECCFASSPESNNYSTLVVSPFLDEFSLKNYGKIILTGAYTGSFLAYINKEAPNATVYVKKDDGLKEILAGLSAERSVFGDCFYFIKSYSSLISENLSMTLRNVLPVLPGISLEQFVFCFTVFYDLGFVYFENGRLLADSSARAKLEESAVYRLIG